LEWAARLHEVGLAIAHSGHHKHGGYVLRYADLPGFSRGAQALLSALVLNHRRKFTRSAFANLPQDIQVPAQRLCALLRLAVVLHRGRSRRQLPPLNIHVNQEKIRLRFPAHWLNERPLTRADLEREARYLKKAGFKLKFTATLENA
jgi:exopolyphosphatase/guanosine-5'-triphosphate,3'-diphosphate pyrophosphatase